MSDENLKDHEKSLFPEPEPTARRGFLVTSLTAGFALAVQPVSAQTITTDTEGLEAGEVKIPAEGGLMPAYRAMPQKGANRPVVLVVHEIFGVHEYIKDVCRRLAKAGYLAVAPDLYARQGRVDNLQSFDEIRKVVSRVPDAQVMADLDAAAAWAANNGGSGEKLAVTGFCWGGRIVWLYAAHQPRLRAGAAWYGQLVSRQPSELQPKAPIDVVRELKAPVLGLYGEADQGIPVETVERMRQALRDAGKPGEIILYPQAPHGFHADYRPSYRKEAAEDGWKRMLAWFRQHGVG
ncbi:MAG: carboxymethylenebutenolidase [Bryobacteraceae bacterium]|nr:MAG: carboxymethylenebutenolidase [Bryobacteraceae bacterium]